METSTSCLKINFKVKWKRMNIKLNTFMFQSFRAIWYVFVVVIAVAATDACSQFIKRTNFFLMLLILCKWLTVLEHCCCNFQSVNYFGQIKLRCRLHGKREKCLFSCGFAEHFVCIYVEYACKCQILNILRGCDLLYMVWVNDLKFH